MKRGHRESAGRAGVLPMRYSFAATAGAALVAVGACLPARAPSDMQSSNPLGPSFWIIPAPSDDDGLLGRSFQRPPDTALSLEEQSQPNPCADKLGAAKSAEMPNDYENAIELKSAASGGAMLGLYGFSADVSTASHLLYKVKTDRRLARLDTTEYVECCKEKGCGWGYVSAIVHGEGEYASGRESEASAGGTYVVATTKGTTSFRVLNRRNIKGYLAAVITAHDRSQSAQACPSGQEWIGIECVDKGELQSKLGLCAGDVPPAMQMMLAQGAQPMMQQVIGMQREQACQWLDAHKQARPPARATP